MGTFLLLVPVKETLVSEELVELLAILSTHVPQRTFLGRLDVWAPDFAKSLPTNMNAGKTIFSAEIIS